MFFQISPVIHKKPKPKAKTENEESKTEYLFLAPFTPNPKIVFNNILVGSTEHRKLIIKNSLPQDVRLFVKKMVPQELNLSLSWYEALVEKESEIALEMTWSPIGEEACYQTIILSDGKKINREVGITLKSTLPKHLKSSGVRKKSTLKPQPVTLPLVRKPISPTKKLKAQKPLPIVQQKGFMNKASFSKQYVKSAHQKIESQQYFSHESVSTWSFGKAATSRENKENISPTQYTNSRTFLSRTNTSFSPNKNINDQRRDTYIINSFSKYKEPFTEQENRSKQLVENNITYDVQGKFSETNLNIPSIFFEGKENSLSFSDSLESPVMQLSLQDVNSDNNRTPTLESLLNRRKQAEPRSLSNFELKLKMENFSPATSLQVENSCIFDPAIMSTTSKPSSTNSSYDTPKKPKGLFLESTSDETYNKINVSSETYVKESSSFETFVKVNISSGTYVKDDSQEMTYFDATPCSSKTYKLPSPNSRYIQHKLSPVNDIDGNKNPLKVHLPAIDEESIIFNNQHLRTGSKRKSSTSYNQLVKREKVANGLWSKRDSNAFRIAKNTSGLNLTQFATSDQPMPVLTETTTKTVFVKNPFLYSNIIDPFMASTVFDNEQWMEEQENNFKKWLNALLTPPDELSTKNEVDVAQVWRECTKKDVSEAPSRETISLNLHTNKKLDSLRKQAKNLLMSTQVYEVLQKVCLAVESGKLSIREDKDIHLNIKLKSDISRLILGYNPLWLRLGLETIYDVILPLKSNSDSHGITNFLLERFWKDPVIFRKHKSVHAPKYSADLKKFTLKKFLILVYFLDQAKTKKLIEHDPCLFCKNAMVKESKMVLIHFARETLSGIGDITKYLKCLGYTVSHVQTYIDEFEYAVKNLGVDLRDGVRLTKVMEIIQMRSDLTPKLRVPAISRLQKIHNTQIVFTSLQESGYEILYDIVAKDIVDGHREKTLSFLWQIIYKFEAPLMVKSASTIQTWFRSLPVQLRRRNLRRTRETRENAAAKIQLWYRRQKKAELYFAIAEFARNYRNERKRLVATIKIQSYIRMVLCKKRFLKQYLTIVKLQARAKGWLIRNNYKQRIDAAVIIQTTFRRYICRKQFLRIKQATIAIQRRFRANKQAKLTRNTYKTMRATIIKVQRRFKANLAKRMDRKQYLTLRESTIKIQSIYRRILVQRQFLQIKTATITIQTWYRAQQQMKKCQSDYKQLQKSTIYIQRRFRANLSMRQCRASYLSMKLGAIRIQSFYRMTILRRQFIALKNASKTIQSRYKAKLQMKQFRSDYLQLKNTTVRVQRKFRAKIQMQKVRSVYIAKRFAAIRIQAFYKMTVLRREFLQLKTASRIIQTRYKAKLLMKKHRADYLSLKSAAITIQRRFRANLTMKNCRDSYTLKRLAAIRIQTYFRMYCRRKEFVRLRAAAVTIQIKYKATMAMKFEKKSYLALKNAVTAIQSRFRANRLMKKDKSDFLSKKKAALTVQSYWRMYVAKRRYLQLQRAAKIIQSKYKAQIAMKEQRIAYLRLKRAALVLQSRLRAKNSMKNDRASFEKLKRLVLRIQANFRAKKVGKLERSRYILKRNAAKKIQEWYKNVLYTKIERKSYQELKTTTVFIQRLYRAKKLMQLEQTNYKLLKNATILIQRRFRAQQLMKIEKKRYTELRRAAITIQTRYRANKMRTQSRGQFLKLKNASVIIQRQFRANISMKNQKVRFERLKWAATFVQRRFRANKIAKVCRLNYLKLRSAAVLIQRKYRAKILGTMYFTQYTRIKWAVLVIQRRYKAELVARREMKKYSALRHATFILQRRFRAMILAKQQRAYYLKFKMSVVTIQVHYKAYLEMKKQRELYLFIRKATVNAQRFSRGYLVRKKYASLLTPEAIEGRRVLKIQTEAAVKIQALWRGYAIRSSNNPEVVVLRKKVKSKPSGQGRTLAQRCEDAMSCMVNPHLSLITIITALEDLDFITRHCKNICIRLSNLLPCQLYIIITSAARSLPEMNALNTATLILINFCKYPETRKFSCNPEALDSLINILLHWCDKEAPLFCTLATLLWLFAHENEWKKIILALPNIKHRFSKISSLVGRKQNMVLKSKQVRSDSVFGQLVNQKLPTRTANWGLDYGRPNTFTNAVHALNNLLNILDL